MYEIEKKLKTPIEQQIGEAVVIDVEKRGGTSIMNSRSEYNRCQIARITTKSEKETSFLILWNPFVVK